VVVVSGGCRSKGPRTGGCKNRRGLLLVEVLHLHYPSSLLSVRQLGHYRDQFSLRLVSDPVSILSLAALLI
jgi:hypothetical protein